MQVSRLDHLVLTVESIEVSSDFYQRVLGMKHVIFGDNRHALSFGTQKINLHEKEREYKPHARHPVPGSADLCFICDQKVEEIKAHLMKEGVEIMLGPVKRTGATGEITSFYFRDPDGNLIEASAYS